MRSKAATMRGAQQESACQNHVPVPKQHQLNGIATSPGHVKQLVVTSMLSPSHQAFKDKAQQQHDPAGASGVHTTGKARPMGASVESQITGKDTVGGIQLEIIPEFETERMWFSLTPGVWDQQKLAVVQKKFPQKNRLSMEDERFSKVDVPDTCQLLSKVDPLDTPAELALQQDHELHVMDLLPHRKTIRDLWEINNEPGKDQSLHLEVYYHQGFNVLVVNSIDKKEWLVF